MNQNYYISKQIITMPRHKLTSLIAAAGLLIPSASYAADYPWLTFHLDDNTEVAVASENLTITYADGTLRVLSPTPN